MAMTAAARGLEDIVASDSGICLIDGDAGVLAYRGIDIHELAEKSTFPETAYLLWFGRLPSNFGTCGLQSSNWPRGVCCRRKLCDCCRNCPRMPCRWRCFARRFPR